MFFDPFCKRFGFLFFVFFYLSVGKRIPSVGLPQLSKIVLSKQKASNTKNAAKFFFETKSKFVAFTVNQIFLAKEKVQESYFAFF